MKKQRKLPEDELSNMTIDDILSGSAGVNDLHPEEEDATEEDLILGDEEELEGDEEEYEVEVEDELDEDDIDEDDLVIEADDVEYDDPDEGEEDDL